MNDEPNYFGELIRLLHFEELLRLQRRCEMNNKPRLAEILADEVIERDGIEKDETSRNQRIIDSGWDAYAREEGHYDIPDNY